MFPKILMTILKSYETYIFIYIKIVKNHNYYFEKVSNKMHA